MYMRCDWTDICIRLIGYIIRTAIYLPIGIPFLILTTIEYLLSAILNGEAMKIVLLGWWNYHWGNVKDDFNFIRTGARG